MCRRRTLPEFDVVSCLAPAARCDEALQELAAGDSNLALVRAEEERGPPPAAGAAETAPGYTESMLRVYEYASSFRLKADDGHHE